MQNLDQKTTLPVQKFFLPEREENIDHLARKPNHLYLNQRLVNIHPPEYSPFLVDDSFYRNRTPKSTHWSVAWSDLMMTMFILFLSMYTYQAAQREFLVSEQDEIVGGTTTEALEVIGDTQDFIPFSPMTATSTKPVLKIDRDAKTVDVADFNVDTVFEKQPLLEKTFSDKTEIPASPVNKPIEKEKPPLLESTPDAPGEMQIARTTGLIDGAESTYVVEPAPIAADEPDLNLTDHLIAAQNKKPHPSFQPAEGAVAKEKAATERRFSEIYDLSQKTLSANDLHNFASVDLVPDKTMRIILTGDLLFKLGQADLSDNARQSLKKVVAVIRNTPYMINVIGHTDNLPMHSVNYASNWELSVARASVVTRFLINEMGMKPNQFVVSGFASYRPVKSNDTAGNRAANRRVEIIISKRLPEATRATTKNLL
ncbi:MAG: OmpA family protein [Thermodesulfobacteriota bacterium]